jgi:DNA-binding CsgD family transcriptional regulator
MADHFGLEIHEGVALWIARQAGAARAADVDDELTAARAASDRVGCPSCARNLDAVSAEALARLGRVDEATRTMFGYEAGYAGPMYPARRALAAWARASVAMASGRGPTIEALDELDEALEAAGRSLDRIWAQLDRGEVLRRGGDRQQAIEAFTEAASRAEAMGAAGLERIASRALRELGVRAWRRSQASRGDGALTVLSHREREVAALVAAGSSNRAIADTLALSPKTVERHITNILAKAGARNRTELAGLIHADSVRGSPDD